MRTPKPKQSVAYKKIVDGIVEIEVAMQRLRENLETGFRNDNTFTEVAQAKKSLDKIRMYVVKLPSEEQNDLPK